MSLMEMTIFESPTFPADNVCQGLLAGHAIIASLGNILRTVSVTIIPPVFAALLSTLDTVFLFCAQYTVMRKINPGHRNAMEVAGAVLVLVGNLLCPVYPLILNSKQKLESDAEITRDEGTELEGVNTP